MSRIQILTSLCVAVFAAGSSAQLPDRPSEDKPVDKAGTTKSEKQEAEGHRKAAEAGDAAAMTQLGVCYENGIVIAEDTKEAAKWFHKGADNFDMNAVFHLGVCYYYSRGGGQG